MLYNKKIKPLLVDQNIIGEYMKEKMITQMKTSGVAQQSELQKLLTKIFYNVVNFIYHYFFILIIFIGISYYLYKRYLWYQEIKTKQGTDKIKKYFDDIMDGNTSAKDQEQNLEIQASQASLIKLPQALHGFTTKSTQPIIQPQAYFGPSKKIDKVVSSNNGYLNHLKQSFDVAKAPTASMGRISTNTSNKTVRFAQGDFDAYGRNNINPKTGETIVKEVTSFDDYIQPYDTKSGKLNLATLDF
jgi:hypothetical protein